MLIKCRLGRKFCLFQQLVLEIFQLEIFPFFFAFFFLLEQLLRLKKEKQISNCFKPFQTAKLLKSHSKVTKNQTKQINFKKFNITFFIFHKTEKANSEKQEQTNLRSTADSTEMNLLRSNSRNFKTK